MISLIHCYSQWERLNLQIPLTYAPVTGYQIQYSPFSTNPVFIGMTFVSSITVRLPITVVRFEDAEVYRPKQQVVWTARHKNRRLNIPCKFFFSFHVCRFSWFPKIDRKTILFFCRV